MEQGTETLGGADLLERDGVTCMPESEGDRNQPPGDRRGESGWPPRKPVAEEFSNLTAGRDPTERTAGRFGAAPLWSCPQTLYPIRPAARECRDCPPRLRNGNSVITHEGEASFNNTRLCLLLYCALTCDGVLCIDDELRLLQQD